MSHPLGSFGVWRSQSKLDGAFAAGVERAGFGALWIGGSPTADLRAEEALLDATESLVVATGIVNIWRADAAEAAASFHRIEKSHPGRFLLGIGSGHREATPERVRPLDAMARYLDALDDGGVPKESRLLAALGPKTLELARDRSLGAHPYLTVPAHTARARGILGPDALLAPEQKFVLEADPDAARAVGRRNLANSYLKMHNYVSTLLTSGFDEDDVADGGSDRLIDALVLHGSAEEVAAGMRTHLDAGADHVALQSLAGSDGALSSLEAMADALGISRR